MKNNKFIQCSFSLNEKQRKCHFVRFKSRWQTYFHLMVFGAFVIFLKINQVGCEDKSVNKKYENEESFLELETENSQEDLNYDPWRDSERPKLFIDYLNGPLKGKKKTFFVILH